MNKDVELCQEIVYFINKQPIEKLGKMTLSHIAKEFNLSLSNLSRIFNKTMDIKLNHFFVRVKILKCALLLHQDSSLSIEEISKISGFSNIDYFNKIFKKHFGTTPCVYSPFKK